MIKKYIKSFVSIVKKFLLKEQYPSYFSHASYVESLCFYSRKNKDWYPPLLINAEFVRKKLFDTKYVHEASKLLERLEPDEYTKYLSEYYEEGLQRFGGDWIYADIVTTLLCLSEIIKPNNYLEIGVRRGRSAAAVALKSVNCKMEFFDIWMENYAGMDNPGPEFVTRELSKIGHKGVKNFHNGNSHITLKDFLMKDKSLFDLITVDGDHSYAGATEDLCDVLPRLKIGGAIVFDDINHPKHPYLRDVWRKLIQNDSRYTSCEIEDLGYGIAFAIRKW